MNMFEMEKLKVNDIVAISPQYSSEFTPYITDCTVTKINGHGHVLVTAKDRRSWTFDKHGNERGAINKYRGAGIIDNDTAKNRNDAMGRQKEVNERTAKLLETIQSCKAYKGYSFSSEVKAKLMKQIANL